MSELTFKTIRLKNSVNNNRSRKAIASISQLHYTVHVRIGHMHVRLGWVDGCCLCVLIDPPPSNVRMPAPRMGLQTAWITPAQLGVMGQKQGAGLWGCVILASASGFWLLGSNCFFWGGVDFDADAAAVVGLQRARRARQLRLIMTECFTITIYDHAV